MDRYFIEGKNINGKEGQNIKSGKLKNNKK